MDWTKEEIKLLRQEGLCKICGAPQSGNRATCNIHRNRNPPIIWHKGEHPKIWTDKEKTRVERWALKDEVFSHYSGGKAQCAHCHTDDLRVLTLDHINSNGAQSRREKSKGQAGELYYRALIKLNYPDGYQVLCANCHRIVEIERFNVRLKLTPKPT